MRKMTLFTFGLIVVSACAFGSISLAKTQFVTIGTGGITGVYYPTGGAIAKMVNAKKGVYNIRATVESTAGSVFNINAVLNGDLEFGIAQSDRQFQAFNGLDEWEKQGAQKDLRAVFSIHPELITLVVADDANINSLQDLNGKKVNLCGHGSGSRRNALDALMMADIDPEKDLMAENAKAAEAPGLLQDGRIDAFFYTVGHPSGAIKEATAGARKVKFIPIEVDPAALKRFPYYARSTIAHGSYPNAKNRADVKTFGVKATLVTSVKVPEETVYAITKEVFDNFDAFRKLHPAYAHLTKESLLEGLSAPVHNGAMKYFKEVGLK